MKGDVAQGTKAKVGRSGGQMKDKGLRREHEKGGRRCQSKAMRGQMERKEGQEKRPCPALTENSISSGATKFKPKEGA